MARARNIKPGFYKNEDLAECSVWARLIFPGLWMLADREGRLEDRPKRIKGDLLPYDEVAVDPLLRELDSRKFIVRYEVDGVRYIQIQKFKEHQSPHYSEKKSVIPPPPLQESAAIMGPKLRESGGDMSGEVSEKPPPIKRGSQPPDSLNPSSLNHEALQAAANPGEDALRRGKACALLRSLGADITSQDVRLVEWVAAGVTDEQLREAIDRARLRKPAPMRIPAAYLAPIVADVLNPPTQATPKAREPEWWASEHATIAKGREFGLNPRPGEEMAQFRGRIRDAMAKSGGKAA